MQRGRIISNKTRIKISKALKGHTVSIESRKKMSDSAKGKIISIETRKKISEANKGKHSMPCKENTKIKLSKKENEKDSQLVCCAILRCRIL